MFAETTPIYLQIAAELEQKILSGALTEGSQVMSTTQYSALYRINPATVAKGFAQLLDAGLLEKRRGIGTFVAPGARARLAARKRADFVSQQLAPVLARAADLDMSAADVIALVTRHFPKKES